jgi:hypothetical protein
MYSYQSEYSVIVIQLLLLQTHVLHIKWLLECCTDAVNVTA